LMGARQPLSGDDRCSPRAKETFFRSSQVAQQNQTEDLH
jgi:hypothetical protein